jgi:hypothetical protein
LNSATPELPGRDGSEPDYEPGTIPLRPVAIVVVILLAIGVGYLAYSCARSSGSSSTFTDQVSHYPPNSVTYIAPARTYLVRQGDGSFLALSEVEAVREDRVAGCIIRFRPDLSAGGEPGVFRDDCHGVLFGRDGAPVGAASPPMQRHPVTSDGKTVSLRFHVCLSGSGGGQEEPCRE